MAGYGRFVLSVGSGSFLCVRNHLLNFCQNISKNASTTKDILLQKPKRPASPFFMHLRSVRPRLLQDNPDIKMLEIVKKASEEWTKLDIVEKERYKQQYSHAYKTYIQRLKEFIDSLTEEQKQLLRQQQSKQSNRGNSKLISQTFGKPKRPLNAYMLYLTLKLGQRDPNEPVKELICALAINWKNMPDTEKEEYWSKAKLLKTEYLQELEAWEKNMMKLGHPEIVRRSTLNNQRRHSTQEEH